MISSALDIPDYHTHHELCRHATGRTIDYARAAEHAGRRELAATDHCPTDCGFGQDHRMTLDEFPRYLEDVAEARRSCPGVTILLGVEADYYPGCDYFLSRFLEKEPFDIVLGSVHFRDYWSKNPAERGLSNSSRPVEVWQQYFHLIGRLADSGLYDVVTHLDLPKRFGNGIDPVTLRRYTLPALDRIAAAGMAIEINTSGLHQSPSAMYPSLEMLSWAAERGIGLVFGSDAHKPQRVGDGFEDARKLAVRAGFIKARRYRGRQWEEYSILIEQTVR